MVMIDLSRGLCHGRMPMLKTNTAGILIACPDKALKPWRFHVADKSTTSFRSTDTCLAYLHHDSKTGLTPSQIKGSRFSTLWYSITESLVGFATFGFRRAQVSSLKTYKLKT